MSDIINFPCPKCGSETFKSTIEIKTYEDFLGATCAECSRVVTDEDIRAFGLKLAEKLVRNALRDAGL
jgi:uncharacterized Zn finger protein